MASQKKYYRKGSSLTEVLVALSLLSLTLLIGLSLWGKLNGINSPNRVLKRRLVARSVLQEAIISRSLQDEVKQIGGMKYLREVEVLNAETGLFEIKVTCFSAANKVLLQRSKRVVWNEN